MIELLVVIVLACAAVFVISILGAVLGAVLGLIMLPFQLLGWLFKGIGFLIALPFLLLGGLLLAIVLGAGALLLFAPLLPLVLLAALAWALLRRRGRSATA